MNKKRLSMICGITLAIVMVSVVFVTSQQSEVLAIGLITPTEADRPTPPSITLGEHGVLTSKAPTTLITSNIRMADKPVSFIDARESNNGVIYQYFGTDHPIKADTKLTDFMESGGIVVETRELRFPERTYTTLANAEDTKNEWFVANGILAFGYEAHAGIVPTTLDLYTDDGKVVSIWTYATLTDTIKIAEKLELQSGLIDLNKYVDPNWTDGPEIVMAEPEPIPEPES